MNINTIRTALIKRAGLFDGLGDKLGEYNTAKAAAQPGAMAGKWLRGKLGLDGQPQQQPQAQQPQATQSVQQPAANALPQDAQVQQQPNQVAQQNEALISSFNKMMNTINSSNKTVAPQQAPAAQPQQQTGASPMSSPKSTNYLDAVKLNNQK